MSCNCDKAKQLPACITQLIIGDVSDGSVGYYVYFKTPDGRIDRYDSVDVVYTDLIGVENFDVRTGTQYEIWITRTTDNIDDKVAFTPTGETETSTCIIAEFYACFDGADMEEFISQEITLE